MHYVYSTLTNSTNYVLFEPHADFAIRTHSVLIQGGANVPTKQLVTPLGARTEVADHDMEWLLKDFHFQQHVSKGFIRYEKVKVDVEEVVKDMVDKDNSAPRTPDSEEFKNPLLFNGVEPSSTGKNSYKSKRNRDAPT